MNHKENCIYYAEKLTAGSWLFHILPYFLKDKRILKAAVNRRIEKGILLYYLDASRLGLVVSRLTFICFNVKVERLKFNIFDIHNENGDLVWWNVIFEDSIAIQKYFKGHLEFQKIIKAYQEENELLLFLVRRFLVLNDNPFGLKNILLFI